MAWERLALIEAAKESQDTLDRVADVFGYHQTKATRQKDESRRIQPDKEDKNDVLPDTSIEKTSRPLASFVRITKIEPLEVSPEQSHDYLSDVQQQLTSEDSADGTYQFDQPRQLLTSAQLIPFLHNSLGIKHRGKRVDQRLLNRLLSKGEAIQKLPFKPVKRWAQQLQVIVDTGDHLRPFRQDFEDIVNLLKQVLGKNNVSSVRLDVNNQLFDTAKCIQWPEEVGAKWVSWAAPPADTPVLMLSDFGVVDHKNDSDIFWIDFSRRFHRHASPVIVLSPVSSSSDCKLSCRFLSMSPLRDTTSLPRKALTNGFSQSEMTEEQVKKILVLLSPLPIIDTGLLRLLRDDFCWGPSYLEAHIWNHPDMQLGSLGIRLKPSLAKDYSKLFRETVSSEDAEKLWQLVGKHHENAYQGLRQLELIGEAVTKDSNSNSVRTYLKQLCATTSQSQKNSAQHQALVMQCKTYLASQPDDIWESDLADVFYDLCGMAYESEIKNGQPPPMQGNYFKSDRLKWVLDKAEQNERVTWVVYQTGQSGEICFEQLSQKQNVTSPLYTFDALKKIPPMLHRDHGMSVPISEKLTVVLNEKLTARIHTEQEYIYLDGLDKPKWATAIGKDKYGLYTDLALTPKTTQRFRWMPGGTFQMGSPKSEQDNEVVGKETLHSVTLSEGFWLADTTVTQAQWEAVTGENPSHFKGDENRPVEQVSWNDSQNFINQLVQHHLVEFQLPSEAQWEYACRAGTTTPFSFGKNITPEQVNYNGSFPYDDAEVGEEREATVPVKSLPCNAWGLYEMHGNVLEWCKDIWFKDLGSEPSYDPKVNSSAGVHRVVRGGSWLNFGGFVRSASRDHGSPDLRCENVGLRLSFGLSSTSFGDSLLGPFLDDKKIKIFISYSRPDIKHKGRLEKRLDVINNKLPLKYWSDTEVDAGQLMFNSIVEKSSESDIVILILSGDSLMSSYFINELELLLNKNKTVVPISIDEPTYWDQHELVPQQTFPSSGNTYNARTQPKLFWDQIEKELTPILKKALRKKSEDSNSGDKS